MAPQPSDCVMARMCTSAWYPNAGARVTLPPLPAWTASDNACVRRFYNTGGYGEMTVVGVSVECDTVEEQVFNRVNYCPLTCSQNPQAPGCEQCMNGGSGSF